MCSRSHKSIGAEWVPQFPAPKWADFQFLDGSFADLALIGGYVIYETNR